ncbi:MAG: hypothetical protein PVSMB4_00130 [Ktedonobacterales bacterium]
MECIQKVTQPDIGVGAAAEARLRPLAPLIEYYAREMGELPGRLMIAASFLADVQLLPDWSLQSAEHLQAVEQAQALVVSVMIRLLNLEEHGGCAVGQGPDLLAERRPDVDH